MLSPFATDVTIYVYASTTAYDVYSSKTPHDYHGIIIPTRCTTYGTLPTRTFKATTNSNAAIMFSFHTQPCDTTTLTSLCPWLNIFWYCGYYISKTHTSMTWINTKPGQQNYTTRWNTMGGGQLKAFSSCTNLTCDWLGWRWKIWF